MDYRVPHEHDHAEGEEEEEEEHEEEPADISLEQQTIHAQLT